jgi:hypothetical protein
VLTSADSFWSTDRTGSSLPIALPRSPFDDLPVDEVA